MEDSDPDVVEISQLSFPPSHFTRKRKQKQPVLPDIIDVDEHDFLTDVVIMDEKVRGAEKGKATKDENVVNRMKYEDVITLDTSLWNSDGKEDTSFYPNEVIYLDDYPSPLLSNKHNASLPTGVEAPVPSLLGQANTGTHSNVGGVFSAPYESQLNTMYSWWPNYSPVGNEFVTQISKQSFPMSHGGLENPVVSANVSSNTYVPVPSRLGHVSNTGALSNAGGSFSSPYESQLNNMNSQWTNCSPVGNKPVTQISKQSFQMSSAGLQNPVVSANVSSNTYAPVPSHLGHVSNTGTLSNAGGFFSAPYESQLNTINSQWTYCSPVGNNPVTQMGKQSFPMSSAGLQNHVVSANVSSNIYPPFWKSTPPTSNMNKWNPSQHGGISLNNSHISGSTWHQDIPPIGQQPLSWSHTSIASKRAGSMVPVIPSSARMEGQPGVPSVDSDEILRKLKLFKHFDIVEGHSDHHFMSSSSKQTERKWAKRIQDEWKILEKDLPDTIYVRVYESRMDLLRAAIVGAEGTPYHDGLFFFDVFFPDQYPNVPPKVHYHSGGLRINPNLYNTGYVCLSLLGTWSGSHNENWQPGFSNVMQVLLSIQALVLNQKPYFNEPGYARYKGTHNSEIKSQQYNENTFLYSLKTMVYSMRNSPKHFDDLVKGHFHSRAKDIIVACKKYMSGAQVGCLVKGGNRYLGEGANLCSPTFRSSLPAHMDMLVKAFTELGVKNL